MTSLFMFILESAMLVINRPNHFPKDQEMHNFCTRQAVQVHVQQSSSTKVRDSPIQIAARIKIYNYLPKDITEGVKSLQNEAKDYT